MAGRQTTPPSTHQKERAKGPGANWTLLFYPREAAGSGMVAIRINEHTTISLADDDYESLVETAEICNDEGMLNAIRESEYDIAIGNVISWEAAKKKLGL